MRFLRSCASWLPHCAKWRVSWPWNSVIRTRILYKYGNFEEYRVPYARRYHQVSWSGFPLIRTFSVSGKIRYLDTSLKRCVSKSMYVRILCDLTRIRIRTLLAHCFIYGGGHWCCLELFHKYCFITNIRRARGARYFMILEKAKVSLDSEWRKRRTRWL